MKKIFRQLVGFIVVVPFALMTYIFSLFIGRERAVKFWGPSFTSIAKSSLKWFIPNIKDASEFDRFAPGMKANQKFWKPIFDFSIASPDSNTVKLHVTNCPFCEVLRTLGLSEMTPYVCQGDREFAKDHADKWDFERMHQIGTGDSFCDHTYKRK